MEWAGLMQTPEPVLPVLGTERCGDRRDGPHPHLRPMRHDQHSKRIISRSLPRWPRDREEEIELQPVLHIVQWDFFYRSGSDLQ